jgi:protein-disulfide isomerase
LRALQRAIHNGKGQSVKQKHRWLIALAIVALVVAACGPQPATPTAKPAEPTTGASPASQATVPAATKVAQPTAATVPLDLGKLPVDPNDWHALGPADAPVTVVEFSEFM